MTAMRSLPVPTSSQTDAARHTSLRLLIEAGPGTGKTFTAAERFGQLAHARSPSPGRGVFVLSFTVSATNAISRAITRRWGGDATRWPNAVRTIDSLFRDLLEYLLRQGHVTWPGGHQRINAIDRWTNLQAVHGANPIAWKPALVDRQVVCRRIRVSSGARAVTAKKRLLPQLHAGDCTHESIRELVLTAIEANDVRHAAISYLGTICSHVIVDEVYDADATDLELVELLIAAGISVTAIGDPWQAVYGFRQATPIDVDQTLGNLEFDRVELAECFRFVGDEHAAAMRELRGGQPCMLTPVTDPDVVLAAEWRPLWSLPPRVLPLSFGQVGTKLDALLVLLLDHYARHCRLPHARLTGSAIGMLGGDADAIRQLGAEAFPPVLEMISRGDYEFALQELSELPKRHLAAAKKLAVGARQRQRHLPRLEWLATRLGYDGQHTPGLTIHQAKGHEWDLVALVMTDDDHSGLISGLDRSNPDHRRLYVGLTRARIGCGPIA